MTECLQEQVLGTHHGRDSPSDDAFGAGISDETKDQLFSPFFSTKPYGQGVGLMLISEILQKHEAHFNLYSERNWTSFEIWFDLNDKFVH